MKEKLMETEKQLNNCPESIRDLWEVQLKKVRVNYCGSRVV